jgi:uncharacterized membrane protein YcaP (DUF421 family)
MSGKAGLRVLRPERHKTELKDLSFNFYPLSEIFGINICPPLCKNKHESELTPIVTVITRTIIVFVCIVAAMRLMGKRQLGELELSELVVAVLISDIAAHPLQDIGIPLFNGLVPIIVLLSCEVLISFGALKSIRFRSLIFSKPSIIIDNGIINQKEMKKNRFSLDELSEELRKKDVTDISKVRWGILETDGSLNVILSANRQPLTPYDMNIKVAESGLPYAIISDGHILEDNIKKLGRDMNWLKTFLENNKIYDYRTVYYLTVDENGGTYLLTKEKA